MTSLRPLESVRRGVLSGLSAMALLALAGFPGRLSGALREPDTAPHPLETALAGTLLDLSAVLLLVAPLVVALTLLVAILLRPARRPSWERFGALGWAYPLGFGLWVLSVVAQEMRFERGSFPTLFDLLEGGRNASFLEGALGFIRYRRVWLPAAIGAALTTLVVALLAWGTRNREAARGASKERGAARTAFWPWALGLAGSVAGSSALVLLGVAALAAGPPRWSAATLGDPMTGLRESTVDFLRNRGPNTPRALVLTTQLPASARGPGAALLGWPPARAGGPHPHARPLGASAEPLTKDPRGTALVHAFEAIGDALFVEQGPDVVVFDVSLEGFRADDVHALNPLAPREIAPLTNSLYEGREGALTSASMFQAGVRTAQGLGARTCGLGTLPYNLSFIRDLHPFPVRCLSDVLHDAGFHQSFFYGSDGTFDGVDVFLTEHGYTDLVTQANLPKGLPLGTWDGVTDFAVFDEAVKRAAASSRAGPQFTLVMSLSNHSPFTAPADVPPAVTARVDHALTTAVNRASADDRLRLVTYSYTDAAVEHLFEQIAAQGLAERSIVVLMADHSTGHPYVWGSDPRETDAARAQIPFAIVIPREFLSRARDPRALAVALRDAQARLDEAPLSQNDVPTIVLALLEGHPAVKALPVLARWHTLGGQVTSPWFATGGSPDDYILGINGKSEFFVLNRQGIRVGDYDTSVFLKTRVDRYRVTPRLIPITATLIETMTPLE